MDRWIEKRKGEKKEGREGGRTKIWKGVGGKAGGGGIDE